MSKAIAGALPKILGVIGAGQMGAGIAQLAAMNGFRVLLQDVSDDALSRGMSGIEKSLSRFVKKGTISEEAAKASFEQIAPKRDLESFAEVDFVVEAVKECETLKQDIFGSLDRITRPEAILASNTSSISITRIANATSRPELVVGMHFMNPPPIMKLVELIRGMQTSDEAFLRAETFAEALGKTVCRSEDRPGFIVNRILMPMINESFVALMEGVGTPEDIDAGMKLGTNQPMGPLALADFIGLDTCLSIMRVLHDGLGDTKYRPCPLLVQYVDAGWLGKKTGRGVYHY
ncbi:3-hydroxybutyryl-CoA dehydrogenase [Chloropicon primus]|uniref:3-hydroxybutyryl-CoA dehydrogenase n=1 Tax=Chloropicon primus TaxID=1764295 RepID=A0A5B8MUL2_9CHLO|nr:3-hydroxybutyryl-CoA dehydrogenase [Chloropicon primus]UPR02676.1 3-hydroxybutyryl-CoA dehydrogenase [Chloropicon primus]|eukprot:QDZ23464.1 3-hydroxybutyryl-CoA dehydrogenase [Chloropicon primus]